MNLKSTFQTLRKEVRALGHSPRIEQIEKIVQNLATNQPSDEVRNALAEIIKKPNGSLACSACQIGLHLALNETLNHLTELITDAIFGSEIGVEAVTDAALAAGEIGSEAALDAGVGVVTEGIGDIAAIPAEVVADVVADEAVLSVEGVIDLITREIVKSLLQSLDQKIENAQVVQNVIEKLCCLMKACPPPESTSQKQ